MDPPDLQTANNHFSAGRLAEAESIYRQILAQNPHQADAHNNLGAILKTLGRIDEAIESYLRAIQLNPDLAEPHYNLGNALKLKNQFDAAADSFIRAIQLKPDYADAHNNLGLVFAEQGRLDEAIAACRLAIQINPASPDAYINLLYALYHHLNYDSRRLLEETRQWAQRQGGDFPGYSPIRDPSPNRKLKIGYLSPFFGHCADAHFILPLLAHHDRNQFEIFCYTRSSRDDDLTARMKAHVDRWFDLRPLTIPAAVELIRSHQLDILVNISRPADPCMMILAHRLAPVQITWLTFASCTTGLQTVDYRISDPHLDPPDAAYSEKTLPLPQTAWCYDPLLDSPPVTRLPALKNRFITFGCLNRFSKINPSVLAAWSEILRTVPNSRLHILAIPGSHRQRLLDQIQPLGIDPRRIQFIDRKPRLEYMKQYDRIDITLDTFPFSGHTTALDSLLMGVPVITLSGRTTVGRAAASALHNLRLPELIAQTPAEYISIATKLSKNPENLSALRATLRPRMQKSPLMDPSHFAQEIENLYRQTLLQR